MRPSGQLEQMAALLVVLYWPAGQVMLRSQAKSIRQWHSQLFEAHHRMPLRYSPATHVRSETAVDATDSEVTEPSKFEKLRHHRSVHMLRFSVCYEVEKVSEYGPGSEIKHEHHRRLVMLAHRLSCRAARPGCC